MVFNPEIHHRRSIRLKGYDYSGEGAYFVTVCSLQKECLFSTVGAGLASALNNSEKDKQTEIILKIPGNIVQENWNKIPERFKNVLIDEFVIMPNHIHGIIIIEGRNRVDARPTPTLGDIICSFKSKCVRDYIDFIEENNLVFSGKLWQRNYYEHIIRNEYELKAYRKYIQDNPFNWKDDEYYL